MTVKVMSYGATITEVDVPDRNGAVTNVVLGVKTLTRFRGSRPRRPPLAAWPTGSPAPGSPWMGWNTT